MHHFGCRLIVLLSSCIFSTFIHLSAQSDHEIEFVLSGTISTNTTLFQYYGDYLFAIDTLDIIQEKVVLKGDSLMTQGLYRLYFPQEDRFFEFIIADDQHFRMRTLFPRLVQEMIIIGSEENQVFYKDLTFNQEKRTNILRLRNTLATSQGDSDTLDSLKMKQAIIAKEITTYREGLTEQYPHLFYTELLSILTKKNYYPISRSLSENSNLFSPVQHNDFFLSTVDFSRGRILNSPVIVTLIEDYLFVPLDKSIQVLHESLDLLLNKTLVNQEVFRYCTFFLLNKFSTDSTKATYNYIWETYVVKKASVWKGLIEVGTMTNSHQQSQTEIAYEALPNQSSSLSQDAAKLNDKAPEIVLEDEERHFVSLYLSESPYTLLVFGDHSQSAFQESYYSLQTYLKDSLQHQHSQLLLFYVDVGQESDKWNEWMGNEHKVGIHVHNHKGRSGIERKYDLRKIPRFFLLDEEKRILFHTYSLNDIYKLLKKTL